MIKKVGSGVQTLTGVSTYTGATSIDAGVIMIGGSGRLGAGSISIGSSGKAGLQHDRLSGRSHDREHFRRRNGQTAGTAATGTIRFGGDNSGFTGTFQVDAGARASLHTATSGSATASFVVNGLMTPLVSNSTYEFGSLSGSGQVSQGAGSTNTNVIVGANGQSTTFSGNIGNCCDSINLQKVGAGTLTLSGNNTYTGSTTVSAGTLQIGDGTSGSLRGGTAVNVASGANVEWRLATSLALSNSISGDGNAKVTLTGNGSNLTIGATQNLTGAGTITHAASGNIVINAGASVAAAGGVTLAAAGNFVNNAGASAVSSSAGRWLIYSAAPGRIRSDRLRGRS